MFVSNAVQQQAAQRAAAEYLAQQQQRAATLLSSMPGGSIPASMVIGGSDVAAVSGGGPSPMTPTHHGGGNYYSQPTAVPLPPTSAFVAQQYIQPRSDHEAVAMQVAVETERVEKNEARLRALKWGRRAEAEALAQQPTDVLSLSRRIQHDNSEGLSEAAARRMATAIEPEQAPSPPSSMHKPTGNAYGYQQQQQQQPLQVHWASSPILDASASETTALVAPATPVVVRAEDLINAMDTTAQQVWQNSVVSVIEAFLVLVLGIVLVTKVNVLL